VQPARLRSRVRKNGLELSDSLFSTGSRINTEFSLGAPGENGFELSSTGSKTSTEIAVTDFLHVRREESLGDDWESELNQRAKEISLMRELGLSTDSTSLSPGDVTDDEDIAVEPAE